MNQAAAVRVMSVLYQAIVAAGADGVPSGTLYALSMNSFESLGAYESCINLMVRVGMVKLNNHVLTAPSLPNAEAV